MRYVALLRGINVGGHRTLPMVDLRAMVTAAGFEDVQTYIQSGNLVVDHPIEDAAEVRDRLEAAIADGAGFEVEVVVRTAGQWQQIVDDNPFPSAVEDPKTLHVIVLGGPLASGALDALDTAALAPEEVVEVGPHLYLHLPDGMGRAQLPVAIDRLRLDVTQTTRNWNTVTKLAEMAR